VASVKPLVLADRSGAATFTWKVPGTQAKGDYYFKVRRLDQARMN
jgi:hypothetical protein